MAYDNTSCQIWQFALSDLYSGNPIIIILSC